MRTSRSAAVATLGLAMLAGCSDAGPSATSDAAVPAPTTDPATSTSSGTSTATSTGMSTPVDRGSPATSATSDTTDTTGTSDTTDTTGTTETSGSDGATIGFDELLAAPDDLIGRSFRVVVRAFFVEQCPPPGTTPAAPCSLSLFVTEPERDHLVYADRTSAIPVFDDAGRVSCQVGDGVTTACAGWTHAAPYELTASAKRSAVAPGIELHITDARLLDEGSARPASP